MQRRDVIRMMGATALLRAAGVAAAGRDISDQQLRYLGEPQPFDVAAFKLRMRERHVVK